MCSHSDDSNSFNVDANNNKVSDLIHFVSHTNLTNVKTCVNTPMPHLKCTF